MTGIDLEDCIFTTTWEKALEFLNKKPTRKQIIEYTFDENGVSDFWTAIHYYNGGRLICDRTLEQGTK